jgi:hypothetical protein
VTQSLVAPPTTAVAFTARLRGFAMCDGTDVERAVGFVRLVRSLVMVPMTTLGLLAFGAALAMGSALPAVTAGAVTLLIVLALWHDTQLTKALELLQRGELAEARTRLLAVADGATRPFPQRQRARAHLAALGWAEADHAEALAWTQARLLAMAGRRVPRDDRFASQCTRVVLLALLGRRSDARTALTKLSRTPDADSCRVTEATTRLLVAFASDDIEPVRGSLDPWEPLLTAEQDGCFGTPLLCWAFDAAGRPEASARVHEHITSDDRALVARHLPRLLGWLDRDEKAMRRYG